MDGEGGQQGEAFSIYMHIVLYAAMKSTTLVAGKEDLNVVLSQDSQEAVAEAEADQTQIGRLKI